MQSQDAFSPDIPANQHKQYETKGASVCLVVFDSDVDRSNRQHRSIQEIDSSVTMQSHTPHQENTELRKSGQ